MLPEPSPLGHSAIFRPIIGYEFTRKTRGLIDSCRLQACLVNNALVIYNVGKPGKVLRPALDWIED